MAAPFIGEIRIFGFTFPPRGWKVCDGGTIPIQQASALYAILGTTYGGNGTTTFNVPNLQGNAAMHWGSGPGVATTVIGQVQGADTVTLTTAQLPTHTHVLQGGTPTAAPGTQAVATPSPTALLSRSAPGFAYAPDATPPVPFAPQAITQSGGNQPHPNAQPRLAMLYCIALEGIFPARN